MDSVVFFFLHGCCSTPLWLSCLSRLDTYINSNVSHTCKRTETCHAKPCENNTASVSVGRFFKIRLYHCHSCFIYILSRRYEILLCTYTPGYGLISFVRGCNLYINYRIQNIVHVLKDRGLAISFAIKHDERTKSFCHLRSTIRSGPSMAEALYLELAVLPNNVTGKSLPACDPRFTKHLMLLTATSSPNETGLRMAAVAKTKVYYVRRLRLESFLATLLPIYLMRVCLLGRSFHRSLCLGLRFGLCFLFIGSRERKALCTSVACFESIFTSLPSKGKAGKGNRSPPASFQSSRVDSCRLMHSRAAEAQVPSLAMQSSCDFVIPSGISQPLFCTRSSNFDTPVAVLCKGPKAFAALSANETFLANNFLRSTSGFPFLSDVLPSADGRSKSPSDDASALAPSSLFFLPAFFFSTTLCGVLVFDSVSRVPPPPASSRLLPLPLFHTQLCQPPSFTPNFVTHHLSHTTLSTTIFHTQLTTLSTTIFHIPSFTPNFVTHHLSHNFVNHHLSHLSTTIFHIQLCHTPSSHPPLSHTIFHIQLCQPPSFTYNFVTHHLSHTTLSHTIFHRQLCHTPSFTHNFVTRHLSHTPCTRPLSHTLSFTYNFVTNQLYTHSRDNFTHSHNTITSTISTFPPPLSHTTLSTIIFHTQLCHTPSFTYNFVNNHLSHTTLSHTIFTSTFVTHHLSHTTLSHTPSFTYHIYNVVFCVAGAAQTHIYRRLAWQAWHKLTSTIVLRGRRGTDGTGWRAWSWFSRP